MSFVFDEQLEDHGALTIGRLKKAIEALPDDTEVIAIVGTHDESSGWFLNCEDAMVGHISFHGPEDGDDLSICVLDLYRTEPER